MGSRALKLGLFWKFGILEFGDLDIAVQVERQAVCLVTLLRSLGKAIERLRQFQVPIVLGILSTSDLRS